MNANTLIERRRWRDRARGWKNASQLLSGYKLMNYRYDPFQEWIEEPRSPLNWISPKASSIVGYLKMRLQSVSMKRFLIKFHRRWRKRKKCVFLNLICLKQKQTKWFNTQLHPKYESSSWLLVKCILFAFLHLRFCWILSRRSEMTVFACIFLSSDFFWCTGHIGDRKRKENLYILFYLTCWRECVSYYVKRNWFWRCSQANRAH